MSFGVGQPGTATHVREFAFEMPQFFFDVRQGDQLFPDEEGQDLPDVEAAEVEAARAAAEIAGDLLPSRRGGELVVDVFNETREPLVTVKVQLHIVRHPAS